MSDQSKRRWASRRRTSLCCSVSCCALIAGFVNLGSFISTANAACVTAAGAVTCTGDFPTGERVNDDFGLITIRDITSDIGGFGFLFTSTTDQDIVFDADTAPFSIVLDPTFSRTNRGGFGARTDGSVSGTISVDIFGPTVADSDTTDLFDLNNFGSFNFVTGTGVDLVHNGEIDISRPTITATTSAQANPFAPGGLRDFVMGQFGAVRIRDASGDVKLVNNGDISLDGGQRNLNVDQSANPGVNQRVFSTRFSVSAGQSSESLHMGMVVEANGDVDITQNGNIDLTGGGIEASSTTMGAIASVLAKHSGGRGVFITDNDFGSVDQVSFADQLDLTINGDVTLTSDEVRAIATAVDPDGGSSNTKAIAQTDLSSQIGVWVNKPSKRKITIDGDLRVINDATTISAKAINGTGEASGLAAVSGRGISGSGFESSPFLSGNTLPTEMDFSITGDVFVQGGDINAEIVGTGTAPINELSSLREFTPDEALRINRFGGSSASGVSLFADLLAYDIGGAITTFGGDAHGTMTGSSMDGILSGGSATSLSVFARFGSDGSDFNKTEDSAFDATGGNASLTLMGTDLAGTVSGGSAQALSVTMGTTGQARYVQTGDVTATGGDASGTASGGTEVNVTGGFASGFFAQSSGINDTGSGTFRNEAVITSTGGDADVTGTGTARGGTAVGILLFGGAGSPQTVLEHAGTIMATGGNGTDLRGVVQGINVNDFGFVDYEDDGTPIFSNTRVDVFGDIIVDGEATLDDFSNSGAIVAEASGRIAINVDGGELNASGDNTHGISSNAGNAIVALKNNAMVTANDTGGHGIVFGPALGGIFDFDTGLFNDRPPSENLVMIEQGSQLISNASVGILDDGLATANQFNEDTGLFDVIDVDRENMTTVDLAGLVVGGSGTAIDLGSGADALYLRATGQITGHTTLGAGDDMLDFEDGFTTDGRIDGGDDRDTVLRNVASGADQSFDMAATVFDNFEVIRKTGDGILRLSGGVYPTPMVLEAVGGTTIAESALPWLSVEVANGAQFTGATSIGGLTNSGVLMINNGISTRASAGAGMQLVNSGNSANLATLSINGDLVLTPTSVLFVDIDSNNNSDLLTVTGTTMLGGVLQVSALDAISAFSTSNQYTIISSTGGVTSTFGMIDDNLPDLDVAATIIDRGDAGADVVLNLIAESGDTTPSDKSLYPNTVQGTAHGARIYAEMLRSQSGINRQSRSSAPLGYAAADDGFDLETVAALGGSGPAIGGWIAGLGGRYVVNAVGATTGYDGDVLGFAAGTDATWQNGTDMFRVGLSFGNTRNSIDVGPSSTNADVWHLGAYGHLTKGAFSASGAVGYGFADYDFNRVIPIPGAAPLSAAGESNGNTFGFSASAYYDLMPALGTDVPFDLKFGPIVRFDHVHASLDAYTETGAGILNQAVAGGNWDRSWASVGALLSREVSLSSGAVLRPEIEVRYERAFGKDATTIASTLASMANVGFSSIGAVEDKDSIAVRAGLGIDFNDRVSADFNYDGAFSKNSGSHRASASFKVKF